MADLRVTAHGILVETGPASTGVDKAGGNVTLTLNAVDITAYVDNSKLEGIVKSFESTVFSSTATEHIPTTGAWAFPLGGKYSIASDNVLAPLAMQKTNVTFAVKFGVVQYSWALAFFADFRVESSSPRDPVQWMASLAALGAPVRAIVE